MRKRPTQIARSLRAFRNSHRLGLLHSVRIAPGPDACDAVKSQIGFQYLGNDVPQLPLDKCTAPSCDCVYLPTGTEKLRQLDATAIRNQ